MPRHKKAPTILPDWYKRETNPCVQSVVEEAFAAKQFATELGAMRAPQCQELVQAAEKSMKILADRGADSKKRCHEGERAARKFWEAKVCARRVS